MIVPSLIVRTESRVARNLISSYGYDKFIQLIDMFRRGTSGQVIADEFGVSRQRVHQWKHRLGHQRMIFILDPAVEKIIKDPVPTRTTI
jgi:transposase-like protein